MRRAYSPTEGRRERDAFESVVRFRVFGWSIVGAFLGFLLGVFLGVQGAAGPFVILATTLIGWGVAMALPLLILRGAGRAGSVLYSPSGRSTPRRREYSLAESYAARGLYDEAIAAFESAISEDSTDPTPYLRIARLKRDRLDDPEGAAGWLRRALADSAMHPGQTLLTRKELVELYRVRMGRPEKAAPLLARIAEESEGTPDGEWAEATLRHIKDQMSRGMEGR